MEIGERGTQVAREAGEERGHKQKKMLEGEREM